jgi:hypothetical protein
MATIQFTENGFRIIGDVTIAGGLSIGFRPLNGPIRNHPERLQKLERCESCPLEGDTVFIAKENIVADFKVSASEADDTAVKRTIVKAVAVKVHNLIREGLVGIIRHLGFLRVRFDTDTIAKGGAAVNPDLDSCSRRAPGGPL